MGQDHKSGRNRRTGRCLQRRHFRFHSAGGIPKKNPKIKVTTVTGRGFELGQRVLSERRAGKYIPDVFIQGATTPVVLLSAKALDPIKPLLILPEVVDESKWFQAKHQYLDTGREYVF